MTNKPMLSERDKFETFWRSTMNVQDMDLHRCEFPMTAHEDQPYACHETDRAWMTWKGRAILDKPVLESQYEGMTQDQAQAVSDGVDEILHGKPAFQHQGGPVAGHCTHPQGCKSCSWCGFKAEQTAPVADHPQCEECKGWGYHENHHEGGGTECGECGGSGNATVAVFMPDVDELAQIIRKVDGSHNLGAGSLAEAIIEEVARMNGVKP